MTLLRRILAGLTLAGVFLFTARGLVRTQSQLPLSTPSVERTPVVVELFTSEGCSSCPPADALLAQLAEQQVSGNIQLIALEEHVDYWNEQGWVDPFSSRDWTWRQRDYSGVLGNGNPYTPQMVVDGTAEFVGSHTQKARQAILEAAGKTKTPVTLSLSNANETGSGSFHVQVGKLQGAAKHDSAEVWLAITETGLHSAVKRGENAGKDLQHAAVVRSMRKIGEAKADGGFSFTGDATLPLRSGWKRENLRAVLFVQERKSRRIVGAAEITLSK
jgi:hypothetical protein